MRPKSADKLGHQLVRLELVSQAELAACLNETRGQAISVEALLRALERRQALTSYQVSKIQRGEAESLSLGRYTLLYRNGSGSFARVFRAKSRDTGQMVGIKLLRQRYAQNPQSVAEFHREAELGKSLKHRNIVMIYDVEKWKDNHFFSMEFVEGGNLRELMRIRKKLSHVDATRAAMDIASGLEYALSQGFTHRDLKMSNVLLSSNGVCKLVDFGLAGGKLHLNHEPGESSARALEYATLEKATGVPPNDPRSDLFFVGAIYYELVTGIPPFGRARGRNERAQVSRYRDVRPVELAIPSLPKSIVNTINRLMQFNPNSRYQRPTDLIHDLRGMMSELGGPAPPVRSNGTRSRPAASAGTRTVMCIENRSKQQNDLRTYFTRHGYRVLMLNDLQRGLSRLETNPPDCMVIMAEAVGSSAIPGFQKAVESSNGSEMITVLVLPQNQADRAKKIEQSPTEKVLVQPITLRDLRSQLDANSKVNGNGKK